MTSEVDDQPEVPVYCPECETTSHIPLADVGDSIERHNAQLHDGDEVAQVDPDVAEHVADLVVEELGLLD